jgi:hypothetical protein
VIIPRQINKLFLVNMVKNGQSLCYTTHLVVSSPYHSLFAVRKEGVAAFLLTLFPQDRGSTSVAESG